MIDFLNDYNEVELRETDLKLLPLTDLKWDRQRGAKLTRKYRDPSDDKIKACIIFEYDWADKEREALDFTKSIEWYDNTGATIDTKILIENPTPDDIRKVNRGIWAGRIDHLERRAEELGEEALTETDPQIKAFKQLISNSINTLFNYYDKEVNHYERRGTKEFENALNTETDEFIVNILNTTAVFPGQDPTFPAGATVKESILYQLTGDVPE